MSVSLEEFVRQLVESELVSPAEVRSIVSGLPAGNGSGHGELLARELVQRNVLTEYQVAALGADSPAELVIGPYEVRERIGRGGMGIVFKAWHRHMKRIVALKLLSPALLLDESALRRFQREVETVAYLNHPNIATAFDAGDANGIQYLVLEYVEGTDLASLVHRDGPLPVDRAIDYVLQTARGLAHAHQQGIIHRDVKPSNLLLDSTGTIKILDLGLARFVTSRKADGDEQTESDLTTTRMIMGTVDYMSPEQALDNRAADHRSDVYSLGCTLYFLLTGRAMFQRESTVKKIVAHREADVPRLGDVRPGLPDELEAAFRQMVAKNPNERPQSMDEVIELLTAAGGAPIAIVPGQSLTLVGGRGVSSDSETTVDESLPLLEQSVATHSRAWRGAIAGGVGLLVLAGVVLALERAGVFETSPGDTGAGAQEVDDSQSAGMIRVAEDFSLRDQADVTFVNAVAFTPDERQVIAAGGDDPTVFICDLKTAKISHRSPDHKSWVESLLCLSDGRVASGGGGSWAETPSGSRPGGDDFRIQVWDRTTADEQFTLSGHELTVTGLAATPDERYLLSSSRDRTARVWSLDDGREIRLLRQPEGDSGRELTCIAVSPDGRYALAGTRETALLWEIESGDFVQEYRDESGWPASDARMVVAVAFTPDGEAVLTAGDALTVVLWARETGEVLQRFAGHTGRVNCAAISSDGERILTAGEDCSVRLWRAADGFELGRLDLTHQPKCVRFSKDGSRAIVGAEDGVVRLLAIASEDPPPGQSREKGGR